MSIKSELTKTASYLRNARKAILGRGGEISPTAGLKDLGNAIFNIPVDSALAYQTDDSIAYKKTVPTGVLDFAKVSKVGGMTYKSKNICPINSMTYPFADTIIWQGRVSGDYVLSWKNNLTNQTAAQAVLFAIHLADGTTKVVAGSNQMGYLPVSGEIVKVEIRSWTRPDGGSVDEIQFEKGKTPTAFEPFFEGLRHTKVTEMKSEGANIVRFPYDKTSLTQDGITFTANEDGTIAIDGTNNGTSNVTFYLCGRDTPQISVPAGTYTISGIPSGYSSGVRLRALVYESGVPVTSIETYSGNPFTKTINNSASLVIVLYIKPNETVSNLVIKPMLNYGSVAVPYEPYKSSPLDTLTIPASVQSIDGYGESNPDNTDEYNYIDFEIKKFVAEGHIVDGVWVRYETPIITDISTYLDDTIEVEGGGTLTAVNEYENAVPTTINYIAETAGA